MRQQDRNLLQDYIIKKRILGLLSTWVFGFEIEFKIVLIAFNLIGMNEVYQNFTVLKLYSSLKLRDKCLC